MSLFFVEIVKWQAAQLLDSSLTGTFFFFPHPVKIVLRFILIVYSLGPLTCFLGRLRHCLTSLKFSSSEVKKITEFEH